MSKRINCPTCGAICNANTFAREGCWSCKQDSQQIIADAEFALFMELPEEERWRKLFERISS